MFAETTNEELWSRIMQSPIDDLYIFESPILGMLKIGHSRNPQKRLASGSTFCTDPQGRIIAIIEGAGNREREVHRAFSEFHSHKEWFFDSPEIRSWIAAGCNFDSLPKQFVLPEGIQADVPCRHNTRHIEGLLRHVQEISGVQK